MLLITAKKQNGFRLAPESRRQGMLARHPCVYILASKERGTLYVGVTSDLIKRIWEHKNDLVDGFTKKYRIHALVWYEQHDTMESAIAREKAIKEWKRAWKLELIETQNPSWNDLYLELSGQAEKQNGLLAAIHGRSRYAPPPAFVFAFLQTQSGLRRNDEQRETPR